MYKLLIIEDDFGIAQGIKNHVEKWGFKVNIATNFSEITQEYKKFKPDIILLDIILPYYDGFYWCQKLREITNIPIIFISSITDNMNIVMAMNMGGDDFIVKPFDINVLTAKINALLRRTYSQNFLNIEIQYNDCKLNLEDQSLFYKEKEIHITKNEFRLLKTLLINRGKVVSREKLMEQLWNSESFVDENTLTVNINRLRKKLNENGLTNVIKTKFGVGYIIE